MLLLVMIGIHASIIGLIRYQASLAKQDATCEVDLGNYVGYPTKQQFPLAMRIHAVVPTNQRIVGRQLLGQNHFQIRQAIEERLRQVNQDLFLDPYLTDLKSQIYDVIVQKVGNSSVEEILITQLHEAKHLSPISFHSPANIDGSGAKSSTPIALSDELH